MENRLNENRQCLDYLGDNDEYSPSQICKKSSSDIETKLKSIRLRHCCERDVLSALHNEAYFDVKDGGAGCLKRLTDLMEADSLAARITCEFMEILGRYDCGHRYSLIHDCGTCKVSTETFFLKFKLIWCFDNSTPRDFDCFTGIILCSFTRPSMRNGKGPVDAVDCPCGMSWIQSVNNWISIDFLSLFLARFCSAIFVEWRKWQLKCYPTIECLRSREKIFHQIYFLWKIVCGKECLALRKPVCRSPKVSEHFSIRDKFYLSGSDTGEKLG